MNIKKRNNIIIATCLSPLLCCALFYSIFVFPIQRFNAVEKAAIPKFEALNEFVSSTIPVPPGVVEIERNQLCCVFHGVRLHVDYQIHDTSLDDVREFYKSYFLENGWEIDYGESSEDGKVTLFSKETACFEVYLLTNVPGEDSEYIVEIYHDFFNQVFSPSSNPVLVEYVSLQEMGSREFLRCPP